MNDIDDMDICWYLDVFAYQLSAKEIEKKPVKTYIDLI